MSWVKVQSVANAGSTATSGNALSLSFGAAVGSGNLVVGYLMGSNGGTNTITSITDDKGNTYTLCDALSDAPNGQYGQSFFLGNITNAPTTLTVHTTTGDGFWWVMDEFSGAAPGSADPRDGHSINNPTGASHVTTGATVTTTGNGDLIWAAASDTSAGDDYTVGTGFTAGASTGDGGQCFSEYQVQSSSGSIAATFTNVNNAKALVATIAFSAALSATLAATEAPDTVAFAATATYTGPAGYILNENGTGRFLLESGSGLLLLEGTAGGGGGSTTPLTITATCTSTSALIRAIGTHLAATCTSTASLIRRTAKSLAATCTSTASLIRSTGKILAATCTTSVIGSAIKVVLKTLVATCTSAASLLRSVGKPLAATCTSTASLIRQIGKTLAATCTSTSSLIRQIGKKLAATCTTSVIGSAIKSGAGLFTQTLVATCTSSSTLFAAQRLVRTLVTSCTSASTLFAPRRLVRTLVATCTSTSTLIRGFFKTLTATCTSTASTVAHKCIHYTQTVIATCTTSLVGLAVKAISTLFAPAKLTTYVPPPQPTLGGDQLYLQQQLASISNAVTTLNAAIRKLEDRLGTGGL